VQPDENADRRPQGYFAFHEGKWWLVNTSGTTMAVLGGADIPNNGAAELHPGVDIRTGEDASARVLRFEWLRP
jgi:hypothetical protein